MNCHLLIVVGEISRVEVATTGNITYQLSLVIGCWRNFKSGSGHHKQLVVYATTRNG